MDTYIDILKIILKNDNNEEFDNIIKNVLIKIFDIYYLEKDIQKYNSDDIFKRYNVNMYNLLKRKYILTKSKKLIFKKHIYDKREYIMFLLKKNNIDLNENESYKSIVDEILKNDIKCYTKYFNNYCHDRLLNKKPQSKICFHPPCFKKLKMIIIVIFIKIKKSVIFKNPYKNKNLYIVYIMSSKKITKLNEFFYMTFFIKCKYYF